jgi:antitoxin component HigA of HigAB toxin-antitoxin module
MSLRTVSTDEELDQALSEIEEFFNSPPESGSEGSRTFDRLAEAIAAFEDKAYPIQGAK